MESPFGVIDGCGVSWFEGCCGDIIIISSWLCLVAAWLVGGVHVVGSFLGSCYVHFVTY